MAALPDSQLAVADKDLVNDVVQRADEQAHEARNGKTDQKPGDFFFSQITGG